MARHQKHSWRKFERRHDKLAPISIYVQRVAASVGIALLLILFALSVGIVGYHLIAGFNL